MANSQHNALMFPLIETPYGSFYGFPNDLITAQLIRYGAHTRNELAMVLSFLKPGDGVVDVGAHIGTFTVPMAKKVGPDGQVFAFEPNSDAFALLKQNIKINRCSALVTRNPYLVTHEPGYYRQESYSHNTGATHFLPLNPGHHEQEDAPKHIESVSIDTWYQKVSPRKPVHFIKIDAEGMELSVLLAAREVIQAFWPILYVEVKDSALQRYNASWEKLDSLLSDWGYHFFRNEGERNSSNDLFIVKRTQELTREEKVYDILCVHPGNRRYPVNI